MCKAVASHLFFVLFRPQQRTESFAHVRGTALRAYPQKRWKRTTVLLYPGWCGWVSFGRACLVHSLKGTSLFCSVSRAGLRILLFFRFPLPSRSWYLYSGASAVIRIDHAFRMHTEGQSVSNVKSVTSRDKYVLLTSDIDFGRFEGFCAARRPSTMLTTPNLFDVLLLFVCAAVRILLQSESSHVIPTILDDFVYYVARLGCWSNGDRGWKGGIRNKVLLSI